MNLQRVAIFVRVVEDGGFTAAAKTLGLPKSSVSRAVSLLEQELSARLLRRSTRKITLTEAGSTFYERASRGLAAVEEAREAVVDLEAQIRGTIRITASVDAGVWILAPIIAAFAERHPAVLVDVALTARVVDLVEERFDLGLRAGPMRDETLVAKRLPSLDFAVYASAAYIERHGAPSVVRELAQHRCVLFRAPAGRATWTLSGPRGSESVDVKGAVIADDFSFALQSVACGAGLGLLPMFVAERGGTGRVTRVLPNHGAAGAEVHLVHPAGRYLPRRVAALRDFVMAELTGPALTYAK